MDDDEEFEQFDAEGDELLAEDSEDENSMQVVSSHGSQQMRDSTKNAQDNNLNPMAALLASAKARAAEFEQNDDDQDAMEDSEDDESDHGDGVKVAKDASRKQFDKVYKQVVDSADVVLYVLDARDPT